MSRDHVTRVGLLCDLSLAYEHLRDRARERNPTSQEAATLEHIAQIFGTIDDLLRQGHAQLINLQRGKF